MKTLIEPTTRLTHTDGTTVKSARYGRRAPLAILLGMVCAILLMDAVLPLRALWFHEALLTQLGSWPILPSQILFPGLPLIAPLPNVHYFGAPNIALSWLELSLLLAAFSGVFLVYLFALRRLPELITRRYLLYSTLLLGFLYVLIPIVTSPDLYSYIAYARIAVLYHLNPLTTTPAMIHSDAIYPYVAWTDQPSAYGPTWAIISSAMQGIFSLFGFNFILPMVITLRLFGLLMHLLSTLLIWSITGHLLPRNDTAASRKRMLATLAFAWNPLLLFEACVNAHNDVAVLFLVLLAIWFLVYDRAEQAPTLHVRHSHSPYWLQRWFLVRDRGAETSCLSLRAVVLATVMLALATCLKLYVVLFAPGMLLFLWMQPSRRTIKISLVAIATYIGVIAALYAPFWQGGAIFQVFFVNPAAYRTINSLPDFLAHLYNAIAAQLGFPLGAAIGSPAEQVAHTVSLALFVLAYGLLFWRALRGAGRIATIPGLVRWMALAWLLYCFIGSPWFWPWYMVTFFGLYAVVEAVSDQQDWLHGVRLLAFSMLSLYCFIAWGPQHSVVPGLPGFLWALLGGLWVWALPVLGMAYMHWGKRSRGPINRRWAR
ncbi:MAG TPA: hypothetical protein VJ761_09315 [Ktedonobacteraceae bacterium]|nr:hypothetical protein [Ktedonobacteraceae bacterium]